MENRFQDKTIQGYVFLTVEDAKLADAERKKIEYLETHMDFHNGENVLHLYKRSIEERLFITPVGYEFLRALQQNLLKSGSIPSEEIPDIPLYQIYGEPLRREQTGNRPRIKPSVQKEKFKWSLFSYLLNIILIVAMIIMFRITLQSDNPNIINYETNLINKYSKWEQQLIERENKIREKEKELLRNE